MPTPTVHILPKGREGWLLKVEGAKVDDGFFGTREEALRAGQALCDSLRASLLIHNADGTTTRQ